MHHYQHFVEKKRKSWNRKNIIILLNTLFHVSKISKSSYRFEKGQCLIKVFIKRERDFQGKLKGSVFFQQEKKGKRTRKKRFLLSHSIKC